jgi:hypothetical protein
MLLYTVENNSLLIACLLPLKLAHFPTLPAANTARMATSFLVFLMAGHCHLRKLLTSSSYQKKFASGRKNYGVNALT